MSEIKGPEMGLSDLLDYEIMEKLKGEAAERQAGRIKFHPLRPSSAGHCSRKLALDLMEYRGKAYYGRPLIEPNIDRLFQLGHSVEYSLLKQFELVKFFQQKYKQQVVSLFDVERSDGTKEMVEGSIDVVFWNQKHRLIADVKSKKDGFSSYFKTKWDELLDKLSHFDSLVKLSETSFYADSLPSLLYDLNNDWMCDNLYQLNLYANSAFIKERGINVCSLIYYNKNDSRVFELRFNPSEEVFNETKAKYQAVTTLVDAGSIEGTTCSFTPGTIRYAFCDCHKILPYSDTDPVKTFFSTLPKKVWPKDAKSLPQDLSTYYAAYLSGKEGEAEAKRAEEEILKVLLEEKVAKVKFDDGLVYEVKLLKSPREHYQLRRSKL